MNYINNIVALFQVLKSKTYSYYQNYPLNNSVDRINDSKSMVDKIYYFFGQPSLIIENENIKIYLGSGYNAANYDVLDGLKITHIINVTDEIPNYYQEDFKYLKIPIFDNTEGSLQASFPAIDEFIDNNQEKKILLVHCYQGASRSASVVLYLLIKYFNYNLEEAQLFLNEKHPIVNININFIHELEMISN